MSKEFEVLHCSCRNIRNSFYFVNIVFRPSTNDFRGMCKLESDDWRITKATTEPEKVDEYFLNISIRRGEKVGELYQMDVKSNVDFEIDDIYKSAYIINDKQLIYNEKFDFYQYREFIMINSASDGIFNYIKELASLDSSSIFHGNQLLSSIKALDFYWD